MPWWAHLEIKQLRNIPRSCFFYVHTICMHFRQRIMILDEAIIFEAIKTSQYHTGLQE